MSATPHYDPLYDTRIDDALRQGVRSDAVRDIVGTTGLAAAGGVGLAGLLGLAQGRFFGRQRRPTPAGGPILLPVRTPHQEEEEKRRGGPIKLALESQKANHWWYWPGITLGGVGGAAGGFSLMNHLLQKKRKTEIDEELDKAKQDYHQALLSQYDPAKLPSPAQPPARPTFKFAALEEDLNQLADATIKSGELGLAGQGLGVYGALAGLLALGTGALAYSRTKERDPQKLLDEAVKRRARERWAAHPPEIIAVPNLDSQTKAARQLLRLLGS